MRGPVRRPRPLLRRFGQGHRKLRSAAQRLHRPIREHNDFQYDQLFEGNRITFGELGQPYDKQTEVHHLPNAGNDPSFVYVLRDREWKGDE